MRSSRWNDLPAYVGVDLANGSFTPIGNGTPDRLANLVWMPDGTLLSLVTTGNQIGYLARINPANGKEIPTRAISYKGQPLGANAFSLASARVTRAFMKTTAISMGRSTRSPST
jgi:hypothetical protein